jgi:hypothetical protein
MGEARRRGTFEERVEQSKKRSEKLSKKIYEIDHDDTLSSQEKLAKIIKLYRNNYNFHK